MDRDSSCVEDRASVRTKALTNTTIISLGSHIEVVFDLSAVAVIDLVDARIYFGIGH